MKTINMLKNMKKLLYTLLIVHVYFVENSIE